MSTFDSYAAYRSAIDTVLALAERQIDVFARDLREEALHEAARYAVLQQTMLEHPNARIRIVVHDTHFIETDAPRLLKLLRSHSNSISINRTAPEARHASDAMILVDGKHLVRRFHQDFSRGSLTLDAPDECQGWQNRFEEIWNHSIVAVHATTLGL